jgi:hypothetical protein
MGKVPIFNYVPFNAKRPLQRKGAKNAEGKAGTRFKVKRPRGKRKQEMEIIDLRAGT